MLFIGTWMYFHLMILSQSIRESPTLMWRVFPAAVGKMTLQEVGRVIKDASAMAEIVGLSITEHLPWDAFNLRKMLSEISIFRL